MVKTLAYADFTKDMAETLHTYFGAYEREGVVRVEITDHGLWLRNPETDTRQFLGSAFPLQALLMGPLHQKGPRKQGAH
jgi:hypothetical protein